MFKGLADVDSQTGVLQQAFGFLSTFRYSHAISGFAARLTNAQAAALSRLPFVAFVAADQTVQADVTTPIQAGDAPPTGVRRIAAATLSVAHGASGVAVAVIDTGGSFGNADLNEISGTNCISPGSLATDDNGHATHVAGTIGGRNNGSGVVGVAPGTTIYAVKVLNAAGSGSWSQVICGIDWVTANAAALNIKVASMSLGGSGSNDNNCGHSNFDPLHTAICNSVNAGVTYVVAAGNNGANMANFTPAAYPEVLAVTAMSDSDGVSGGIGGSPTCRTGETDDSYASFSNYASGAAAQNHTIAGPGVCILSDWLNNGFNVISGTSMATPHVSGSVALCLAQGATPGPCAGMTPSQIIQKMRTDAANHAAAVPGDGFQGDPAHAISGRYYGYLVWDGADLGGGSPQPDFSISATPASRTVTQGGGTSYSITITPQNGFAGSVNLSVGGLGSGAGGSFSPASATTTSTLNITTTASASTGSFPLTITGTSGSLFHQTGVTLVVNPSTPVTTVPDAPNLTSATAGNASVALAWSAPGNNGGSALTGYNVYRGTSSGTESLLTSLGLQTSYTDTGREQRHDLLVCRPGGEQHRPKRRIERALGHPDCCGYRAGRPEPDLGHGRQRLGRPGLERPRQQRRLGDHRLQRLPRHVERPVNRCSSRSASRRATPTPRPPTARPTTTSSGQSTSSARAAPRTSARPPRLLRPPCPLPRASIPRPAAMAR